MVVKKRAKKRTLCTLDILKGTRALPLVDITGWVLCGERWPRDLPILLGVTPLELSCVYRQCPDDKVPHWFLERAWCIAEARLVGTLTIGARKDPEERALLQGLRSRLETAMLVGGWVRSAEPGQFRRRLNGLRHKAGIRTRLGRPPRT